ncbi:MAG TPA: hypothetical protein VFA45_11460, partial [Actinomycetes bacterium]|nr:hypothetical protein [Actinomycetes bacterium]
GTGHGPPRVAAAVTTTTTAPPEAVPQAQRTLGWRTRPAHGITVTALSVQRIVGGDPNGDDVGQLTIAVQGVPAGRLLGLAGLELLDLGGGVFATASEERPLAGTNAAPVRAAGQAGTYVVDLGPTPGVNTLASIRLQGLVLSQPPSGRTRIELDTGGRWPSVAPLRVVEPSSDAVAVDLHGLRLRTFGGTQVGALPLLVAGAFVGAHRAVVAFRLGSLFGGEANEANGSPQVFTRQVGDFPVSARLLAGDRVVCERTVRFGQSPDGESLVVIDCPVAPAARLAVELGAGAQTIPLHATLARTG